MVINHNMGSMNASRQMGINSANVNKSMKKLSSGLRINCAADDAAGLSISEKMRGQIRGLDQAERNAQDGISMIQTAEGALNETTAILQRMRELSVQSANGIATDNDRAAIQAENAELEKEIDRIAGTTHFNTKILLDGSIGKATDAQGTKLESKILTLESTSGTNTGYMPLDDNATVVVAGVNDAMEISVDGVAVTFTIAPGTYADKFQKLGSLQAAILGNAELNGKVTATLNGDGMVTLTSTSKGDSSSVEVTSTLASNSFALPGASVPGTYDKLVDLKDGNGNNLGLQSGDVINLSGMKNGSIITGALTVTAATTMSDLSTAMNGMTGGTSKQTETDTFEISGQAGVANGLSNIKMNVTGRTLFNNIFSSFSETQVAKDAKADSPLMLQVGANAEQTMSVDINDMSTRGLGLGSTDISTQKGAQNAIGAVDNAISIVSQERAKLGAISNRLEHKIANLGTASENLTSTESRIRDVDMVKEISILSKNNIFLQADQAMLAQANQSPQGVLQLLR